MESDCNFKPIYDKFRCILSLTDFTTKIALSLENNIKG